MRVSWRKFFLREFFPCKIPWAGNLQSIAWGLKLGHSVNEHALTKAVYCLTKIDFGSITCTPLLPSTSSVISTSPATLVSM